jgi:hypothetical protein
MLNSLQSISEYIKVRNDDSILISFVIFYLIMSSSYKYHVHQRISCFFCVVCMTAHLH